MLTQGEVGPNKSVSLSPYLLILIPPPPNLFASSLFLSSFLSLAPRVARRGEGAGPVQQRGRVRRHGSDRAEATVAQAVVMAVGRRSAKRGGGLRAARQRRVDGEC